MTKIIYAGELYRINSEDELLDWADRKSHGNYSVKRRGKIKELYITLPSGDATVYFLSNSREFHVDYVHGLPEK